ncbi:uncharacterized protein LOC142324773 [Lycorma delicatula]|uniref:uncharacterized protein LOC142324773 n=1 Tax=Lycorma delicatula TaxID=130591 RepID=UPI003F50F34F
MSRLTVTVIWSSVLVSFSLWLLTTLVVVDSVPRSRPRFIAIPLEDVQLVEVEDLPNSNSKATTNVVRVPRGAQEKSQVDPDAGRFERQAANDHHHHEYVDFGAHTGHKGSFGWYADFPVQHH